MRKQEMPKPVNLNDCVLLYQMGYATIVNDGKVVAVVKESKKKNGLKPHIKYLSLILSLVE